MTSLGIEPWEPEESVGKIWHVFASKLAPSQEHDGARVDLAEMRGRISVLFRGQSSRGLEADRTGNIRTSPWLSPASQLARGAKPARQFRW